MRYSSTQMFGKGVESADPFCAAEDIEGDDDEDGKEGKHEADNGKVNASEPETGKRTRVLIPAPSTVAMGIVTKGDQ